MRLLQWGGLALALALGACSSEWMHNRERGERAATTYPPNAKAEIVAFLRSYLNDPSNIRDAYFSEPTLRHVEGINRYSVCVRYNARDVDGRYSGPRDNLVLFRDGRLDRLIDNRIGRDEGPDIARELCKSAAYQRFPELEALKR